MDNTLQHHGIKGQKWGVRRTQEQLDRAAGIVREVDNIEKRTDKIGKAVSKKKDLSKMTNQELQEKVNRLNLEKQYSQLTSDQISKGRDYVRRTIEVAGNAIAIGSSAVAIAVGIQQLRNKI